LLRPLSEVKLLLLRLWAEVANVMASVADHGMAAQLKKALYKFCGTVANGKFMTVL
jgi:hypothetical protein